MLATAVRYFVKTHGIFIYTWYIMVTCFFHFCMQADMYSMYGVDWDGPLPLEENDPDTVSIPAISLDLSDDVEQLLVSQVNPLAFSHEFGIDLYLECLRFLSSRL